MHDTRMLSADTPSTNNNNNRSNSNSTVWTLKAHNGAVTALSYSQFLPGLLATASTDKTWKLWDIGIAPSPTAGAQPTCIYTAQSPVCTTFMFAVVRCCYLCFYVARHFLTLCSCVDTSEQNLLWRFLSRCADGQPKSKRRRSS